MIKELTAQEVNRKYQGKYIEVYQHWDYTTHQALYEIRKVYSTVHENTTLGEDVGTNQEYRR